MTTPKYPEDFKIILKNLGHDLIKKLRMDVGIDIFEDHTVFVCNNCKTIFTISGGWERDKSWYVEIGDPVLLYYWSTKAGRLTWRKYPNLTCKECIIKEIIE